MCEYITIICNFKGSLVALLLASNNHNTPTPKILRHSTLSLLDEMWSKLRNCLLFKSTYVRSCCLSRRSVKILALWENHSFKRMSKADVYKWLITLDVCQYPLSLEMILEKTSPNHANITCTCIVSVKKKKGTIMAPTRHHFLVHNIHTIISPWKEQLLWPSDRKRQM